MSLFTFYLLLSAFSLTFSMAQPIGPNAPAIKRMHMVHYHACAITEFDQVMCYGSSRAFGPQPEPRYLGNVYPKPESFNDYNFWEEPFKNPGFAVLDIGENEVPINVHTTFGNTLVHLKSGKVKCFADPDEYADNSERSPYMDFGTSEPVKQLSTDFRSVCALFNDGQVKCADFSIIMDSCIPSGWSDFSRNLTVTKVLAAPKTTCAIAILEDGTVNHNQDCPGFRDNSTVATEESIIDFGGQRVIDVATSYYTTCYIFENKQATCVGLNNEGQCTDCQYSYNSGGLLGLEIDASELFFDELDMDNIQYINFGTGRSVKKIATGNYHSCAILDNDKVKCWGADEQLLLGIKNESLPLRMGDEMPYVDLGTDRTAKEIVMFLGGTCVLLDNDQMKCFGYIEQAGGTNAYRKDMEKFYDDSTFGINTPFEMGDDLPYVYFVQPSKPMSPTVVALISVGTILCVCGIGTWMYRKNRVREVLERYKDTDEKEVDITSESDAMTSENPNFV